MSLAMPNIKSLLASLRKNDWYITAFPFDFYGHNYVVVFEDLREIDMGTKYFAACLTFIDIDNQDRRLETYANSYRFNKSDNELIDFFGIVAHGNGNRSMIWQLYNALNAATPSAYHPIDRDHTNYVVATIDRRESNNEGFCCYGIRRNGKNSHGEQIYRSAKNTAKTRLLRPKLFDLIGVKHKEISFCYRQENELDDATIALTLKDLTR